LTLTATRCLGNLHLCPLHPVTMECWSTATRYRYSVTWERVGVRMCRNYIVVLFILRSWMANWRTSSGAASRYL
jgi:hypothetical protein